MIFKKFCIFWLPPFLWMAFIFPQANRFLGSSKIYEITVGLVTWLFPQADYSLIEIIYILERKTFHFIEYAILALLLLRGFRGTSQRTHAFRWTVYSGIIALGYAILDESLQTLVPTRNGSVIDGVIDSAGIFFALVLAETRKTKLNFS